MIVPTLIAALILVQTRCCFIVHFVYYGQLSDYDFLRISRFNYPYIFHLDQQITLPDNHIINRNLTPVQKSDVKKMEVIYHHGGLYIDNDHFIDTQCIRNIFCPLKNGMYLLDWTDRAGDFWLKSAPISFIYSYEAKNSTIYKILTSYNQSVQQTIYFSGPFHVQKFRSELKFVKVNPSCEYHIGIQSWNKQKNFQYNWIMRKWSGLTEDKKNSSNKFQSSFLQQKQMFFKLWKSHSVIYPFGFNYSLLQKLNSQFNHVELVDKDNLDIKLIQYSEIPRIKEKLLQVIKFYEVNHKMQAKKENQDIKKQLKILENNEFKQQIKQNSQLQQFNSLSSRSKSLIFIVLVILLLCVIKFPKVKQLCKINLSSLINFNYQQISSNCEQGDINQEQQKIIQVNDRFKRILIYAALAITVLAILSLSKFQKQDDTIFYYNQLQFQNQLEKEHENKLNNKRQNKEYRIKWQPSNNDQISETSLKQLGIYENIHPNSKFDYLNTTEKSQFKKFKHQFDSKLKYSVYSFPPKKFLNKDKQMFQYKQLTNQKYIQKLLLKMNEWGNRPLVQNSRQLYLASYLTYNSQSQTIKQIQRYYYNKKYKIQNVSAQLPLCIITTQSEIKTQSKIQSYFQSIQRQNYLNYHIVLIDDNSPSNVSRTWFKYLQSKNYTLKNKLKIVRNHVKMGILANHYAYARKLCNKNEIVVNLYIEDSLIGKQVFNLLNSVYQDQNIWYTYSRSLFQPNVNQPAKFGNEASKIVLNFAQYRTNNEWRTSGLRTYRQRLMQKVPIEHFIQYQYDNGSSTIVPVFPKYAHDRYEVFAHLQLCGGDRVKYIEQALILTHDQSIGEPCEKEHIRYFRYKAMTKRSMKRLENISSPIEYLPDQNYTERLLIQFRDWYNLYNKCYKIFHMEQNLI